MYVILTENVSFQMGKTEYLSENFTIGIEKELNIGFYLSPVDSGLALDQNHNVLSQMELNLIDIIHHGISITSLLSIRELTSASDGNCLIVELMGGQYRALSEYYEVGTWHYVWVVFNGNDQTLDIYIDGKLQTLFDISGTVPSTLFADVNPSIISQINILVNQKTNGQYNFNQTYNSGLIRDLLVMNTNLSLVDGLQKIINQGLKYAIYEHWLNLVNKSYGIMFSDPSTLRVNCFVDDMSYVYIGRNDGKILRGSPLFWESRRMFDEQEKAILDETIVAGEGHLASTLTSTNLLSISNSIVRL